MDKSYEPQAFETRWYAQWEASGCFAPSGQGRPYTILLPPPNVTGTLHMGHAFQHTLMDALIRYQRMCGRDTLWQVGTDHAGIATEMVVARNLGREGLKRDELGREAFIEKVWEWKGESGDNIARQMRRIGASGDWSRQVFTMDPMPSAAVVEAFVRLHEQGLIYRGQRLVNWDPVLKTAISDLEVVSEEEDGFLWSIAYPLSDGSGSLVVATTRPETMLGDVAVMVHPEDERYAHLVGKSVRLPLCDRLIPVIADTYVDRAFGTGVVKVTPAHDFNDYQVWQRHKDDLRDLPGGGLLNILTADAKVVASPRGELTLLSPEFDEPRDFWRWYSQLPDASAEEISKSAVNLSEEGCWTYAFLTIPARYRGLDRFEARKVVLADLEAAGLLVETTKHKLQVPRGDRTGQIIEPYLTNQWFVKMDVLAKRGLELAHNGSVKFVPPNWISTYRHWMENIQDWCISRQLWWGHQIPAWMAVVKGEVRTYVARSADEARTLAIADGSDGFLMQEQDVLETWFSSALWPFSTMGWPNPATMAARGFDRYLPSDVLVTGFDIIFFWVARMIFMTDHFTGRVPFREVYITGLVRDAHGQKMSKSKGNVLDPIDLIDGIALEALVAKRTSGLMKPTDAPRIEKATRKEFPDGIPAFGADALRFTFASLATHGRDIKFDLKRCEGYKNFCNKLWNAARFVLMNCEGSIVPSPSAGSLRAAPDEGARPIRVPSGSTSQPIPATGMGGALEPATDAERWILAQLSRTCAEVQKHFASYRFDLVAQTLYEFTWNTLCDWFLELAKPALGAIEGADAADADRHAADSTRHTLLFVLEATLRLLHPLIPFVTEEIWQAVAPKLGLAESSISLRPYPQPLDFGGAQADAEADVEWLRAVVGALRRIRSELNVAPSKAAPLLLQGGNSEDRRRMDRFAAQLQFLARAESIAWLDAGAQAPAASTALVGELLLSIPLAGLIDLDAERARLDKEVARVRAEVGKCEAKLANPTFVDHAPAAVVAQERARLADWTARHESLQLQLDRLLGV